MITATGAATPSVVDLPAAAPVIDSRVVINVADAVFTKAHVTKPTAGLSGRTSLFPGTFGIQYTSGSSDDVPLRDLPTATLSTAFSVKSLGFVYSLTVLF